MIFGLCTLAPPSSQCLSAPQCQRHWPLSNSLKPTLPNPSCGATFFPLPFSIQRFKVNFNLSFPSYLTALLDPFCTLG